MPHILCLVRCSLADCQGGWWWLLAVTSSFCALLRGAMGIIQIRGAVECTAVPLLATYTHTLSLSIIFLRRAERRVLQQQADLADPGPGP